MLNFLLEVKGKVSGRSKRRLNNAVDCRSYSCRASFFGSLFCMEKRKGTNSAGYVEGEVKDKKKASKYSGIYLIGLGVISVLFLFFLITFITYFQFIWYRLWLVPLLLMSK